MPYDTGSTSYHVPAMRVPCMYSSCIPYHMYAMGLGMLAFAVTCVYCHWCSASCLFCFLNWRLVIAFRPTCCSCPVCLLLAHVRLLLIVHHEPKHVSSCLVHVCMLHDKTFCSKPNCEQTVLIQARSDVHNTARIPPFTDGGVG